MHVTRHLKLSALPVLLSIILLALPRPGLAQTALTVDTLDVRIWPEFDKPSALVIVGGQVSGAPGFPVDLTFALPATAALNAVAYDDGTGALLTLESSVEGNLVTLTSPNGSFHIEFYDLALNIDGQERSYDLNWAVGYPVAQATIEVQQPPTATGFTLTPAAARVTSDSFNLTSHVVEYSNLAAGDPLTLSLTYQKADDSLTFEAFQPAGGGESLSGDVPAASSGGELPAWAYILIAVIAALALAGGIYYAATQGMIPVAHGRHGGVSGGRFCTQCGKPASAEARFCPHCGAKLR